MIRIELVRVGDRLVGRTVSCRWNLRRLGIASVAYDRNQADVKRLRRALARLGLSLSVVRGGEPRWLPSPTEASAFDGVVPAFLSKAA